MDPFLDFAVWLTINELTDPWIAAVKSGAWKFAGREKQLEFALKAIEPKSASEVLGQLIPQKGVARDGAGPWIELIGSAGGADELRRLFDQLLRGEFAGAARTRAFKALGDAARLRTTKPAGELEKLSALLSSPDESVRTEAIQLAGTWKLEATRAKLVEVAANAKTHAPERAAAFEALREIGGKDVIADLTKLAGGTGPVVIRREAAVTLASLELPTAVPHVIAALKATTDEAQSQALWRSLLGI